MSKSKGNLVLVSKLRAEGRDPMAIRLALLAHHYRSDWEWFGGEIDDAEAATRGLAYGCCPTVRSFGRGARHRDPGRDDQRPRRARRPLRRSTPGLQDRATMPRPVPPHVRPSTHCSGYSSNEQVWNRDCHRRGRRWSVRTSDRREVQEEALAGSSASSSPAEASIPSSTWNRSTSCSCAAAWTRPGSSHVTQGSDDPESHDDESRGLVGVERGYAVVAEAAQEGHGQARAEGEADEARHLVEAHGATSLLGRNGADDESRKRRERRTDADADECHADEDLPERRGRQSEDQAAEPRRQERRTA